VQLKVLEPDLKEIIEEDKLIYPSSNLKLEDVSFYHVGISPRDSKRILHLERFSQLKKSKIIDDEALSGIKGYIQSYQLSILAPYIALKLSSILKKQHPEIPVRSFKNRFR